MNKNFVFVLRHIPDAYVRAGDYRLFYKDGEWTITKKEEVVQRFMLFDIALSRFSLYARGEN